MSNPLIVKCPTCGEGAGKSCRDYGAIKFRASKFERAKAAMRNNAPLCQPHASRKLAAEQGATR